MDNKSLNEKPTIYYINVFTSTGHHTKFIIIYHHLRFLTHVSHSQVFNRLTQIANSASLYCNSSSKFFFWLSYYQSLYSQTCKGCGKVLCDENNSDRFLPPIRRDFNYPELAYHLSCFQNGDDIIT